MVREGGRVEGPVPGSGSPCPALLCSAPPWPDWNSSGSMNVHTGRASVAMLRMMGCANGRSARHLLHSDCVVEEKTVVLQKKENEGFGFVLRGAKGGNPCVCLRACVCVCVCACESVCQRGSDLQQRDAFRMGVSGAISLLIAISSRHISSVWAASNTWIDCDVTSAVR